MIYKNLLLYKIYEYLLNIEVRWYINVRDAFLETISS